MQTCNRCGWSVDTPVSSSWSRGVCPKCDHLDKIPKLDDLIDPNDYFGNEKDPVTAHWDRAVINHMKTLITVGIDKQPTSEDLQHPPSTYMPDRKSVV
mgnify:CR=1 FL=1